MMKKVVCLGWMTLLIAAPGLASTVAGTWVVEATSASGDTYKLTMVLRETEGTLSGTLGNEEGDVPLERIQLAGDDLSFDLTTPEGVTYSVALTVSEDGMKGNYQGTDGSSGSVTARRAGDR